MQEKLKIGILIADFERLQNFELRIIQGVMDDPSLELSLLVKDGRQSDERHGFLEKIQRFVKLEKWFALLFLKIQLIIESKLYKHKQTTDKKSIVAYLNTIPTIALKPTMRGYLDIFSKEDADIIRQYKLDIILRHEFRIIRGELLSAAKHGIWSFHHADNSINRGGPPCFWENVLKQPIIGVTLQQLTPELDGGSIIDKAFFDRHFSYNKSNNDIFESSVSLLFKNIKKLQQNKITLTKSGVYCNPLYKTPSFRYVFKYIFSFYKKIFSIVINRLLYVFGGFKEDCWTLFLGKGQFMEAALFRLKPIKLPRNEFWADPFLFKHTEGVYIFFENFNYKQKKGKISCGKVIDNTITDIKDVLNLKYHLSYPFIFEEDGVLYMIPETSAAKRVEIYKCSTFPDKWELYATAFEGEEIVDTSYYKDDKGQRWIFLNKGFSDSNSELHIFRIDSLTFDNIQPHMLNPVIIDTRIARNAGPIFKYNDLICRPSQCNINGIYGYGLNINSITTLTIDDYREEKLITIEPNFKKGITATHHLHQFADQFVIDACFKRYR